MVKLASGYGRNEIRGGLGERALRALTIRMRASATLGVKLAAFYAAWILATYALGQFTANAYLNQIVAIGYWFGWLFAAFTVAFAVFILTVGVFRDVRK